MTGKNKAFKFKNNKLLFMFIGRWSVGIAVISPQLTRFRVITSSVPGTNK
jgi:hypothetical protein